MRPIIKTEFFKQLRREKCIEPMEREMNVKLCSAFCRDYHETKFTVLYIYMRQNYTARVRVALRVESADKHTKWEKNTDYSALNKT